MTLRNNSKNKQQKKAAGYNLKLSETAARFQRAHSTFLSSNMPLKTYNKYTSRARFRALVLII